MLPIILMTISLLLDGILTNFLPFLVNDLTLFTPMFTLVIIFLIYPFYKKHDNKFFITLFILGIIYDLFYTDLLFLNAVLFLIIGIVVKYIYKYFEVNFYKLILYTILIIIFYESLTGLILFIFNVVPVTIDKVIYKITHSIILNIIYIEIMYLIIKLLPKKYTKTSIY